MNGDDKTNSKAAPVGGKSGKGCIVGRRYCPSEEDMRASVRAA